MDEFDFSGLSSLLAEFANDVTSPELQGHVQALASDAVNLVVMRAKGASDEVIKEMERDLKARGESLANIPGLIAAGKQEAASLFIQNIVARGVEFAFAAARKAIVPV